MATNSKGPGTKNIAVNLLNREHEILARIAITEDRSLGDEIRRLAVAGLKATHQEAAFEMELARRNHREQLLLKLSQPNIL